MYIRIGQYVIALVFNMLLLQAAEERAFSLLVISSLVFGQEDYGAPKYNAVSSGPNPSPSCVGFCIKFMRIFEVSSIFSNISCKITKNIISAEVSSGY